MMASIGLTACAAGGTIACLPRRAPPFGPQVPEASLNDPGIFDRPRRADVMLSGPLLAFAGWGFGASLKYGAFQCGGQVV